jgi:hypothetical protein
MDVHIPVSISELIDKITILQIKASRFQGEALSHVQRELELLEQVRREFGVSIPEGLESALAAINAELWTIEDAIREQEAASDFGERFIELARSVYGCNDQRAALKRQINASSGSSLVEEKSYSDY